MTQSDRFLVSVATTGGAFQHIPAPYVLFIVIADLPLCMC